MTARAMEIGAIVWSDDRVAPFRRDEHLEVLEVRNTGTPMRPYLRALVRSVERDGIRGWLDATSLAIVPACMRASHRMCAGHDGDWPRLQAHESCGVRS